MKRSSVVAVASVSKRKTFSSLGPLLLDLRSTVVDLVSGDVAAWPDQALPAQDFSQGTALARPAWVASATPNGKPALRGGTTKYLLGPSDTTLKPSGGFTVFFVAKRTGATPYQCLANGSGLATWLSDWGLATDASGTVLVAWAGAYTTNIGYAIDTAWHIFEMVFSGTALELLVDGVSAGTVATTMAPTSASLALMAGLQTPPSTYAFPWGGDLADVKVYDGALSVEKRASVRSLLTSGPAGYLS